MNQKLFKLSIIIPVYNEKETVHLTLDQNRSQPNGLISQKKLL